MTDEQRGCKYCNHELMYGSEGSFQIRTCMLHKRDGSVVEQPILGYEASGEVFSTELIVEDHIVIKYCPMCGRKL